MSATLADPLAGASLDPTGTVGTWTTGTDGNGNPVFTWDIADCFPGCEMTVAIDFSGEPGVPSYFSLYGEQENDPLVSQTVTNNSQATWLDWHVDVLNATISRTSAPVVKKVAVGADATPWQTQFVHNDGYTDGFGAAWVGGGTSVAPGQRLSVKFTWTPNGQGPVTIRQYPTDTGAFIPEPSSMLALMSGLGSLGIAFIRRRR